MGFEPSNIHDNQDPVTFPPTRVSHKKHFEGVEMPEFIKDEELRKGPTQQNTLAWMNAVQTHLDDFISWDRLQNGDFTVLVHSDTKICQVARIRPGYLEFQHQVFQMKGQSDYVEEDLLPAINVLAAQEKTRKEQEDRHHAIFPTVDVSEQEKRAKKRKQEEDDYERNAKKRKQDINKKLDVVLDELQVLHKLVNKKIGNVEYEIAMGFVKLSQRVDEIMRAEASRTDTEELFGV